jgi:tRNA A37 threonylcarbamoyltransferase TsaD
MSLVPGIIATPLTKFIIDSQKGGEVSNPEEAAAAFAKEIEKLVFDAIKAATGLIPAGTPITTTSGPGTIAVPVTVRLR